MYIYTHLCIHRVLIINCCIPKLTMCMSFRGQPLKKFNPQEDVHITRYKEIQNKKKGSAAEAVAFK